jgi:[ribosomal protein S18]-alanine N-acetyltransferase
MHDICDAPTAAAPDITIRRVDGDADAWACADIMASTDPWLTYGRTRDNTFLTVSNPQAESYAAVAADREVVGVVVIALRVPLISGYICGLAVKPAHRNRGIGSRLLRAAEARIFRESPNVFLCVTSFNTKAQRLYARLGYLKIGEITDFAIPGAHEHLLRKTLGPQSEYGAKRG